MSFDHRPDNLPADGPIESQLPAEGRVESQLMVEEYLEADPDEGGYEHHLDRADDRWAAPWWKGWLIVLTMIVIYLLWTGTVYFLEPGIR